MNRLSTLIPIPVVAPATVLAPALVAPAGAETRRYYVAAEEAVWDYPPFPKALIRGLPHGEGVPKPWAGNTRQKKVRYVEDADDTFTTRKPQPEWLGILGPVIRAEVEDTELVHFLNRTRGQYSMHPHGLRYTKEHEDVDRELVLLFSIFDDNRGKDEQNERELMHAVNGHIFGGLPGLAMNNGERVRWHVLGMGNELDLHSVHWHAKTLRFRGRNTDVIELLPGSMATADMLADNPGTWLLHCHVGDHMHAGMVAVYTIK